MDLTGKNFVYYGFTGVVDSTSVTRLCQALNVAANNKADGVYLCLSSLGGFVADGVYLYNHIRGLPIEVIMHATGTVASIAATIFVAASIRYCSANAMFMMHPTTVGPFAEGIPAGRLQSALDSAIADDERTERILRERTFLTDDVLQAKRVKEVHLSPQEALKFGLVHEVREFILPRGVQLVQI
jgi:ATP-dependent protease ClpP protease subunit